MRLNGSLLRDLRQQRQYSPRHVASIAGISALVLQRIEEDEPNGAAMLTVSGLIALADALGVAPADLFSAEAAPAGDRAGSAESTDAALLAGLLLTLKNQTNRVDLATALGWTSQHVNEAAAALARNLDGTGIALHQPYDRFQLVPEQHAAVNAASTRLTLSQQNKRGMDATTAKTLYKVYKGRLSGGGRKAISTTTALRVLTKSGALVNPKGHTYAISVHLRYALDETT